MCREDQLASVQFPDVCPTDIPKEAQFSMVAGDFVEIYTDLCAFYCYFLAIYLV